MNLTDEQIAVIQRDADLGYEHVATREQVLALVAEVRASRAAGSSAPSPDPTILARALSRVIVELDDVNGWLPTSLQAQGEVYEAARESLRNLGMEPERPERASGSSAPRPEGFPDDVPALTRELCAAVIEDDEMGGDLRSGTATRARALLRSLDALAAGVRPEGHADDPGAPVLRSITEHDLWAMEPESLTIRQLNEAVRVLREHVHLARVAGQTAGRREGIEEALREVNAMKQRNAMARDRAAKAGRKNVASHRQSDVETCEQIETALRSLTSRGGGSRKDG